MIGHACAGLAFLSLFACVRSEDSAGAMGIMFRAQCGAQEPGALAVAVQDQTAWFGPPRQFRLAGITGVDDAQGHPAIRIEIAPEAIRQFEAFTSVSVAGPLGVFLDGELVAAPAIQPVDNGRFTFCNEAGGWSATDRDLWLARMRAAAQRP
jgi:hypothetical protein